MRDRILIVDAIATNRIVLKIKFTSCFYAVSQATCIGDAVDMTREESPDLILTATHLPDGCAGRLARELAMHPQTRDIPIIALGAGQDAVLRRDLLQQGLSDVLPVAAPNPLLLARARSVIRAHHARADWFATGDARHNFGMAEQQADYAAAAHIRIVSDDRIRAQAYARQLRGAVQDRISVTTREQALHLAPGDPAPDVYVLALEEGGARAPDQLHLISSIRTNAGTRHKGIVVLQPDTAVDVGAQALDLGADDLMQNGFDLAELRLRLAKVLRQVQQAERMRRRVDSGLREAMFDPLTTLPNRRYALSQVTQMGRSAEPFAVMVADIDHFKRVNDLFGHAAGDAVLVDAARRLRLHLHPSDMAARLGGEEFLLVLPGASAQTATRSAQHLCKAFRDSPFVLPDDLGAINMTISIGICMSDAVPPFSSSADQRAADLIGQADLALYKAKDRGRNCVRLVHCAA